MFRRKDLVAALAAVVCIGFNARAYADPMLRLDDGAGNVVTVADGDGDGIVAFVGGLGGSSVWSLNITVGRSRPNVGSAASPSLRLTTTNVSSTGGGTLTIQFSDTDFGPSQNPMPSVLLSNSSDNLTGTVTTSAFIDLANSDFNTVTQIGPTLIGSGIYDLVGNGSPVTDANYSLNLVTTLTHDGTNTSQFDSAFDAPPAVVPEPASFLLFGVVGVAGMLGYRVRRGRKAKIGALAA